MTKQFGFIPAFASFLIDDEQREQIAADYVAALQGLGGKRWTTEQFGDVAPLFLLVTTGGTESVVMDLVAERQSLLPDQPVYLIAHPGNNSLPASLEVLARLQQEGARGRIFYLQGPEDLQGLCQIETAVQDISVRRALKQARIGLLGRPSDWLVASSPEPALVSDAWGPEIVEIAMDKLTTRIEQAQPHAVASSMASLAGQASEVVEPTDAQLRDVVGVQVALRQLVADYQLDAITVRCFDLVLNQQTTGCFGLAELTDEGCIAGCEGDLVSTVGMLWAYLLLGEIPWMANPAQIDEDANTLWLAHCTVPRRRVESYRLRSHFESGLGVGIQGVLPTGPVTLLRIGGSKMERLWLAEGNVLRAGDAENLCRTQAQVGLTRGSVTDLLRAPLGNHLVVVPGRHADRLNTWWKTARL